MHTHLLPLGGLKVWPHHEVGEQGCGAPLLGAHHDGMGEAPGTPRGPQPPQGLVARCQQLGAAALGRGVERERDPGAGGRRTITCTCKGGSICGGYGGP